MPPIVVLSGLAVMDPVVVAAFQSRAEAAAALASLERAEIPAEVSPRSDALERLCLDAFDSGFDVIVDRSEASTAIALLQRLWPEERQAPAEPERCPACGATDVARLARLKVLVVAAIVTLTGGVLTGERDLFLLVMAIVAALIAMAPSRRCRSCQERWRPGDSAPAPEDAHEIPIVACPRCGSEESLAIDRRKDKAMTLLVNFAVPPTILFWPFRARNRCGACGHEWR